MKNSKRFIVIYIIALFIPLTSAAVQDDTWSQEKIVEEVEVTAAEIPVRIFHKGEPVVDLKKSAFKLFINGKEREIKAFYQLRKRIGAYSPSPRLFVLMFNVCDYYLDIESTLDRFFSLILRPNDRIMIITNNFFINDKMVVDPQEEKERVKQILKIEKKKTERKLKALELRFKTLVRKYKYKNRRYGSQNGQGEARASDFINNYVALVNEFKTLYLDLSADKYIRLAQHLGSLYADKWVLGFYQVGRFFKPRFGSEFFKNLLGMGEGSPGSFISFDAFRAYERMQAAVETPNTLPMADLVKLYTGTGATFHTVIMKQEDFLRNEFASDLTYVNIVSESYDLLKKLTLKTGGRLYNADEIDIFYQYMVTAEDVHYILAYTPNPNDSIKKKKVRIKITVNHPNYRVFYDDKKRSGYFRRVMKKHRLTVPFPRIRIRHVEFKNQTLSFVVSNFKVKDRAGSSQTDNKKPTQVIVKLPVRIQVFNKKSQTLFDGVEMFKLGEADAQKRLVKLQIAFPKVPPGSYDVFIWVGDPLTGKRDLAIKELNIK